MNEDQRQQWKRALADQAAAQRRPRYRPQARGLHAVKGVGMVRIPPAAKQRPAEAGRHSQPKGK